MQNTFAVNLQSSWEQLQTSSQKIIEPARQSMQAAGDKLTLFAIKHPILTPILGLAAVNCMPLLLQTLPIFEAVAANIGHNLPGMVSQTTPQPCIMPDQFSVPAGSSISKELWALIAKNGQFSQELKLEILQKVLASNTHLGNPDIIDPGTQIKLNPAEICRALFPHAGEILQAAPEVSVTSAAVQPAPVEVTPIFTTGNPDKDVKIALIALFALIFGAMTPAWIASSRSKRNSSHSLRTEDMIDWEEQDNIDQQQY